MYSKACRTFSIIIIVLLQGFYSQGKTLIPFKKDYKYGYIDLEGNVVVKPLFERTFPFKDGLGRFKHKNLYGYFNEDGKILIRPQFEEAWDFHEGLAKIRDGIRCGFINKQGQQVIKVEGEECGHFHNGIALIQRMYKYGYINQKGDEIFEPVLTQADPFENGVARIKVGDLFGMIDTKGDYVLYPIYDFIGISDGNYVRAKRKNLWYVYDIEGVEQFSTGFTLTTDVAYKRVGFARYNTDMVLWNGYLDMNGEEIIEARYIWTGKFHDGLAVVKDDLLFYVINTAGEKMSDEGFTETLGRYSEGRLGVKKKDKWGFIDERCKWTVRPKYLMVHDYHKGYAMVSKGRFRWGAVSKSGDLTVPMNYEVIVVENGYLIAILGELRGFYDFDGKLLYQEEFDIPED